MGTMTQDELKSILRIMLENGVSKAKFGDLEVEFRSIESVKPVEQPGWEDIPRHDQAAPAVRGPDGLTKEEAELAYYSARD